MREDEVTFCTDEQVIDSVRRLERFKAVDPVGVFEVRSQVLGFSWSSYSLLTDARLVGVIKPASQLMHDWMHGLFSNGVFNTVLQLLLNSLEGDGLSDLYPMLAGFVQQWNLPMRIGERNLGGVFETNRRKGNRDAGAFRAQASEGLSLYPLLTFWVESMLLPRGVATPACQAFVAFANVADCCKAALREENHHVEMRLSIHAFLAAFQTAFSMDDMSPKFHWMLHYARELRHHGFLLSCFVHERKHKTIRRYATPTLHTPDYERTVIREVVSHTIRVLEADDALDCQIGLVAPRAPPKRLRRTLFEMFGPEVLVASECRFSAFETCRVKDFVFIRAPAGGMFVGEVWVHVQYDDQLLTIVSSYRQLLRGPTTRSAQWQATGAQEIVSSMDILAAATWLRLDAVTVRTLLPRELL